ncbi:NADPH-dependent aldehyde reductase Ahr [Magnetococcus sp. PR-3]|uniref:NADPH-dependent aldehyde reductase Ahr n=1 Tax=Magnetococcus sp. PR-3 TaxID=3120355 RepID=UPI003FA5D408
MIRAYAAMEAKQALVPFDYDPGQLGAHEVEIAVRYCGICHSDVSMLDNDWGISQYPLVPGHEVVGEISAIGDHVKHLKLGQKVGLGWHAGYCQHCSPCVSGDHNLCGEAQGTIVAHHGGFADRVRAQATSVVPLPEGLDMSVAGPLFCGGVTVFNPLVQYDVKPTDRVAVIGIGGLGHMAVQFLNAWGCEVTAFTSSDAKREEALELGAHQTLNSRDGEALAEAAGRFDLILSTVNVSLDWNAYIGTLKPKGRLHLLGAVLEPLQLNLFPMLMGQRSVSASPVGSPSTIAKMLSFAAHHKLAPQVEIFPMAQVNEAIAHLKAGKARYRIVLQA